jgi:hypothetical protein
MIRQNVLLSNANKSNVYDLNNDITLNFPTSLFFRSPQYIELLNLDLDLEIGLFGNSNNSLYIIYNNIIYLIVVEFTDAIKTDYQLTQAINIALNNPRNINNPTEFVSYGDNLIFNITESSIENVVTNYKIERESGSVAYTITCNNSCTIDFNHKDSIGPILGFGNGIYTNITTINSTSTQSISAYNYIDIINSSGSTGNNTPAGPFPNYNDVNCKMVLYNSDNLLIPNKYKTQDTTISLNLGLNTISYENIGQILQIIEDSLNDYSTEFSPAANFLVTYDNSLKKITISNTTGAKFGIGFDFGNITKDRIMTSSNGTSWTSKTSGCNNDWRSVVYGNVEGDDILVAVASSGLNNRIMIAENSINNWRCILSPADNDWTSITWASELGLFCAVSASGNNRVMTSTNGITWTLQNASTNNEWRSVTWGGTTGNKQFVAVASSGTNNRIMTSSNGINWISRTSPANNYWTSVTWSPQLELFCAVASSGTSRIMRSTNGITWTLYNAPDNYEWRSVTWGGTAGNEKFVAVASSGVLHRVMTSSNGITWTRRHAVADNYWTSVTWTGLNKFVAVASSGTNNRIMYSSDGIAWTGVSNSPINIDWNSVIWAGGNLNTLVSVGSSFGNSSGSLHYILGFEQKSYLSIVSIMSVNKLLCYEDTFADDYVLICSDIVNNATDITVIGIGNADNIKSSSIIFAIPLSKIKNFTPVDSSYYKMNIASSKFSLGYKNKLFNANNPNLVNFYLRLLSGRHITCTSQFTMQLSFIF